MADVTAALVTLNDIAICGSDGSIMLVASVAIDVELVSGNAKILLRCHRDDGKRFVDLEQVDIADAPADLVEQFPDRRDRRGGEPLRLLAVGGVALDLGQDRKSFAIGER